MSPADFLLTLAEVSIAFVGFSAIVIVFQRFASGRESRFQSLQVTALIRIGLLALFLSLLPVLIGLFPIAELAAWRIASVGFAAATLAYVASYARQRAAGPVPPTVRPGGYRLRMGSFLLVAALQGLNATLLPASVVPAVYCAGVVWLLVVLGWIFLAAWRLWGAPAPDAGDPGDA